MKNLSKLAVVKATIVRFTFNEKTKESGLTPTGSTIGCSISVYF
ncbi:hypothetical protein SAMN04515674_106101 [Pseudarcicella hirudinis]|uniref:Uncharacterized protein n=1 Tax=Pseudarcicella hirudinis TaxID=1079859 RepID=A0A1I5TLA9_9BACT|nr:hypothetical protein SAMN04515674_106101 [Pseudarcicella hirudinis]